MRTTLHGLLQASAERAPGDLAVAGGDDEMTYAELETAANRLANWLISAGVSHGDRVGVYLPKSVAAVVGVYAAMKAGAAYVPLDPSAPASRVAYIAANCDIEVMVTGSAMAGRFAEIAAGDTPLRRAMALDVDGDPGWETGSVQVAGAGELAGAGEEPPAVRVVDQDLAYILYTSGSTGDPKGVMLTHRNCLGFVEWAVEEFGVGPSDRLSQMAPLHFDLSTFDLYAAALAGASVHLVRPQTAMFPMQVRSFLEDSRISVTYAVPSLLIMLTERAKLEVGDLTDLRTVLFAGEVFPTKYLSRLMRLLPHARFANLYGPTETNVCTFYVVPEPPPEDGPPISIGRAIDNVETVVVVEDAETRRLAEPGETGELWVRGPTVMAGYWGDAERTARTRVISPFSPIPDPMYRTGDLVIEEPDGNYTFLGRRDNQIKSRGHRIELGDIEAALSTHSAVVECAVIAVPDELITNRIRGFALVNGETSTEDLLRHLAARLPKYMVPEELELRESLPHTSTGKIDRQTLVAESTGAST